MIRLTPFLAAALVAAALALSGAAGWQGYRMGGAAAEGRQAVALAKAQRAAISAAELASRKEAARLALQTERDALARDLEEQANADANADRPALGADSVRRIGRR